MKKIVVIGAGFAGLAAAALLSHRGFKVTLLEKNDRIGGRARLWEKDGYSFDMGPSWYLMPEVFERIFERVGADRADYYQIRKLDPAYRVFFESEKSVDVPGSLDALRDLFRHLEHEGDKKLDRYLCDAKYKYDVALSEFLYRDYPNVGSFFQRRLIIEGLKLHVFNSLDRYVRRYFQDHRARKILEYATVFLGSSPQMTPALYSLMSHVDLNLGVWFPEGGMAAAAQAFGRLAEDQGVTIICNAEVRGFDISRGIITGAKYSYCPEGGKQNHHSEHIEADAVLNTADYHWLENHIIDKQHRSYSPAYWKKRIVAPSMLLAYMGIRRKVPQLAHHNLYFSRNWENHFKTIFKKPGWPENPCWYISRIGTASSANRENLFLLVPLAPNLEDTDAVREEFFSRMLLHIKQTASVDLEEGMEVRRLFSHRDFKADYRAFQGTALGLSHTLFQTAVFRPSRRSRKIGNLFHAGQYTHPGIGVPMVLISAELAADSMSREYSI